MAYTKIKPIRATLQKCINYTTNPEKTERASSVQNVLDYTQNGQKTEQQLFVTGFHCTPQTAYRTMQNTRSYWNKEGKGHVLGYHVIQSFAPREVTPEQAHRIGCAFVERLLPQYEATVSTHLDREHLHNHIVFNAVSFVDGKMYRDDFKGYFTGIRGQSDALCKEYGLSVISPQQKGKAYNERMAEKQGRPTVRGQVKEDVDRALEKAISWQTFVLSMQQMGYTVRWGQNVKYATVQHRTGKRAIRLKSLGEGYSEAEIRARLEQRECYGARQWNQPTRRKQYHQKGRYRGCLPFLPQHKLTGFMALYYHYVYLFRKAKGSGHSAKRTQYLLREDLAKFDHYLAQAQYVWANHIETNEDLVCAKEQAEAEIERLAAERAALYRKRTQQREETKKEELTAAIRQLTGQLRQYRKEMSLCSSIETDTKHLRQQLIEAQRQECAVRQAEQRKEKTKREYWR